MIIDLFFEGTWAVFYLSSLTILVPAVGAMLAARTEAAAAAFGYLPAVILVAWLRFSENLAVPLSSVLALAALAGTVGLIIPIFRRVDLVSGGAGAIIGAVSAALWWPTLGANAYPLFNNLPTEAASGLVEVAFYMVGIMTPVIIVAIVFSYIPSTTTLPFRPFMLVGGLAILGLYILLILTGTMPTITDWLAQRAPFTPIG